MRRPTFRAALSEARADQWAPAAAQLRSEVQRSIDTLVALRDGNGHSNTKLRAAVAIVELATKLHRLCETPTQFAAMEAALDEIEDYRRGMR